MTPDRPRDTAAADRHADTRAGASSTGSAGASRADSSPPNQSTGWKFIASWVAFAITLLLTVALGVQVVIGTKGLG